MVIRAFGMNGCLGYGECASGWISPGSAAAGQAN